MTIKQKTTLLATLAACVACTGSRVAPEESPLGTLEASLSRIPENVACFELTASESRVVDQFISVTPGSEPVSFEVRLPLGSQTVIGRAFEAPCPADGEPMDIEPAWISDPASAFIVSNQTAHVLLSMHRRTNSVIDVDFEDEGHVVSIAAGDYHQCALLDDKTVRCWGLNDSGQLGDGTNLARTSPAPVTDLANVRAISAGGGATCALRDDGTPQCWGVNINGVLGDGTQTDRHTPTPVVGLDDVQSITPSMYNACAIRRDGSLWCWGSNYYGLVGSGLSKDGIALTPVRVPLPMRARTVALGGANACVLLDDGSVSCWGDNQYGQLGDGTQTSRCTPGAVLGLTHVRALHVGRNTGYACAIMEDATVRCWGRLPFGETYNTPTAIEGLTSIAQIGIALVHACAVRNSGELVCWGSNSWGALGIGTGPDQPTPITIPGLAEVESLAINGFSTCVLSFGGVVKCTGSYAILGLPVRENSVNASNYVMIAF